MAGAALAAVPADVFGLGRPAAGAALAASPVGDVVGKITVGYQGWFACTGDGAPINGWWHWSQDWGQPPSASNTAIRSWPDVRDYGRTYPTAYASLNNGQPATLFSSYDQQTVDTHFQWMQESGCDTAALQRFNPFGGEGPTRDAMATKVRAAAESYARKFYIMYDVTNWTNMQSEIKTDWTTKMSAHTASPAYARQNGRPVVCVWGFGFNDPGRPFAPAACLDVVTWFKAQGCYVIGGVPTWWRTGVSDSRPGFLDVYHAFNMLSPWMVGRIGDSAGSDWFYTNANAPDQADCNANGIDYQPCVLPGDVTARQRRHGDFMWRQFYNMVRVGAQGIYISMFDEYNEGNQIAKTAETLAFVPANSGMLALDEDGTACSADYYLRLTGDGGRMLKGQLALTATRPTQPVVGGGGGNIALGRPMLASSWNNGFVAVNAGDGNVATYWESANSAFPQWIQVDLGAPVVVGRVVLKLPAGWGARTQTLSVSGSTDGSAFGTIVAQSAHHFNPATGNAVTIVPAPTPVRYVRVTVNANTGWPAAQVSEFEVYAAQGDPPPNTNLARGKPTAESSHTQSFGAANAVDGNAGSYWESTNNVFPQWIQVDLGAAFTVGRVVLKLPPASAWSTRVQTLSVLGSGNGSSFTTIAGSSGYTFDPATGNTVSISFAATSIRYLRINVTANTGWPAGQLGELEAYAN